MTISRNADALEAPARKAFIVTASASAIVDDQGRETVLKALRATGAGTVTIKTLDSTTALVHPVADGERIDVRITHVTASTGVTGLIGYA